jgi:hypothetical protein
LAQVMPDTGRVILSSDISNPSIILPSVMD